MERRKKIWIILDFHSGKKHMHQWLYVQKYSQFLKSMINDPVVCWLPTSADRDVIKELKEEQVERILSSPEYNYSKNDNRLLFVVSILVLKFLNSKQLIKIGNGEIFKKYFAKIYFFKARKLLIRASKEFESINIVMPTTSPLALRLLKSLPDSVASKTKSHLGFLTGENKGIFSFNDFTKEIFFLSEKMKLTIGAETRTYMRRLEGIYSGQVAVSWSPVPSMPTGRTKIRRPKKTIGFIGNARPNKGFVNIPALLKMLDKEKKDYSIIIQKSVFPWPGYDAAIKEMQGLNHLEIQFINGSVSQEEFLYQLSIIDVLVLPYFSQDYKYSGSGLLFLAADFHIPVVSSKGLSFDWDITNFGFGTTYSSSIEFVNSLKLALKKDFYHNFTKYNIARRLACKNFLNL